MNRLSWLVPVLLLLGGCLPAATPPTPGGSSGPAGPSGGVVTPPVWPPVSAWPSEPSEPEPSEPPTWPSAWPSASAWPSVAPTGAPVVRTGWRSCALDGPPAGAARSGDAVRLPRADGFAAVGVTVCEERVETDAAGFERRIGTEGFSTDLRDLPAALRLPDEPRAPRPCPGAGELLMPFVVLHDAHGRWVRPGVPADRCGRLRREIQHAADGLILTTVAERLTGVSVTTDRGRAGCPRDAMSPFPPARYAAGPPPGPGITGDAVRLCTYFGLAPSGSFLSGGVLPRGEWAVVAAQLRGLPAAQPCRGTSSRFAVLRPAGAGAGAVWVELGGCGRVLVDDGVHPPTVGQATPELAGLLDR